MLARIIESERTGAMADAVIVEADDGLTAIQAVRDNFDESKAFHVVLMDNIMVLHFSPPVHIFG